MIGPLAEALGDRLTGEQRRTVERAYAVAAYWHRDQLRRSGDPYITHPVAVAVILAELGMDAELICAGLLHDVLADTGCTEEELTGEFGEPIVALLRGVGVLDDPGLRPDDWETSTDERVLTLKLADRLHNQRTMRFLPEERRLRKSQETLDFHAPIADRLGLERVGRELERLANAQISGKDGIQAAYGVISAGAIMLPSPFRARWLEEWLGEVHALPDKKARMRFAGRLVLSMPHLAAMLRVRRAGGGRPVLGCLRWLLASDVRTWALLTPLLAWLVLDTAADRLGDAAAILITVPPVLAAGVRALRAHLGIHKP